MLWKTLNRFVMEPANSLAQKWAELVENYNGGALQQDEAAVYIAVVASTVAGVVNREATLDHLRAVVYQLGKFPTVVQGADYTQGHTLRDGTYIPPQPWPGIDPSSRKRERANAIAEAMRRASWYRWLCERSAEEVAKFATDAQTPQALRTAFLRRIDCHNAAAAAEPVKGICLDPAEDVGEWIEPA